MIFHGFGPQVDFVILMVATSDQIYSQSRPGDGSGPALTSLYQKSHLLTLTGHQPEDRTQKPPNLDNQTTERTQRPV